MYPKVKVKEYMEEADQYAYEQNSLQSLKAFEWLSPHHFHPSDESAQSVVRIPGSFMPKSPTPTFRTFKEDINEKNKAVLEETGKKGRATSAPRPRAVLSSPDNDGIFGSKGQTRKQHFFGLKNHFSSPNKHPQSKVFPRSEAVTLSPAQVHKKEAAGGKSGARAKVIAAISDSSKRAHHEKRVTPFKQLNFQ